MHIFSVRPTTAFSRLGTPGSTSALLLGAIFSSITTNKKHKNVKTHGTNRELHRSGEETLVVFNIQVISAYVYKWLRGE